MALVTSCMSILLTMSKVFSGITCKCTLWGRFSLRIFGLAAQDASLSSRCIRHEVVHSKEAIEIRCRVLSQFFGGHSARIRDELRRLRDVCGLVALPSMRNRR